MPFLIVALEIPPLYFLGRVAGWNVWLAILFLAVGSGIGSTVKWSPVSHFGGDRVAQQMLHRIFKELFAVHVTAAVLLGGLALASRLTGAGENWWGFSSCGVVLATLGMIVARMEVRLARFYAHYGVSRPPFN